MFKTASSVPNLARARSYNMSIASVRMEVTMDTSEGIDELKQIASFADITLTYFHSSLYATVLEDVIAQLYIFEECNNSMRVAKAMCDMVLLLGKKYGVPERRVGDELDDIDPKRLDCMQYKMQKLQNDRKHVRDVLVGTYKDLTLKRRSRFLRDSVSDMIDRTNYRENLIKDEAANRILRRELNRQLRHQRNHIKSLYYDTDAVIQDLRTRVEDADLNSHIRRRYVENWQHARTEQHLQTISNKESKPLEVIMLYKQRADQEQRVHTEVELVTNISINETLQKVEQWMNKYDRDIEAIDLRIQKKKNQYEDMQMRAANLENTIEEHAMLIKNWVTYKEEREQARLYREKMHNAAVTVQAWWRGLLVRYQLGPYKPVKKKPMLPTEGKKKKK